MTQSAHFINKRDGPTRAGMSRLGGKRYRSCCWAISEAEAQSLLGGWVYFHQTKADRSAFGGFVDGLEKTERVGTARECGYAITFEARPEGRNQQWRGANHAMAWWSGPVELSATHEENSRDA